ncbi:hypothetical protein [Rhodanobacter sp. L36]|uniref:hypothetical protein n=1 Tax=Rhodanobacter sp. L36 TaxID=1747221 RepID=UPI00131B4CB8|nr:hypothetical protein [Rhodanobacter sp. L36]
MTETSSIEDASPVATYNRRSRGDALGVGIASMIGLLALLVSGYTAYIQRQQVRAQVWPYLSKAYVSPTEVEDKPYTLAIFNKGVGPAIVQSVQVSVDGKSQTTWKSVFDVLGLPSGKMEFSSLDGNVLSPGETLPIQVFHDAAEVSRFRQAMKMRVTMHICYCSTLGECWMLADQKQQGEPDVQAIAKCPRLATADTFTD